MRRIARVYCGLATAVLLVGMHVASAATIAEYSFEEFTTTNDAWPAANGPYTNTATTPGATATDLGSVGLASLEALSVRDASHGDLDSYALLIGPGSMTATLSEADNYFGFTVSADSALLLNSFSFDLGVSNSDNNPDFNHEVNAQFFYSLDGGATFLPIGDVQTRATVNGPDDDFTGMINSTIDLTSLEILSPGESVEFRLALANNRGYSSAAGAVYLDNLVLDATVVPEPATLGLVTLVGCALLARRRR